GSASQVYLMLPHKQLPFILLTGRSLLLLLISLARTPTSNSDGMIAGECVRFRPCTLGRDCRVVGKLDLNRRRVRAAASTLAAARTARSMPRRSRRQMHGWPP